MPRHLFWNRISTTSLSRRTRGNDSSSAAIPPIEQLEDRKLFSVAATLTPAAAMAGHTVGLTVPVKVATHSAITRKHTAVSSVLPLTISGVTAQNGQLVAQGLLGTTPFSAPITVGTQPSADPTCPILSLHLGPIHLNVLGLVVDTSEICLDVTADPNGGLLGNLLCNVAHLLDTGSTLGTILGGLTGDQLNLLTSGLTGLLSGALGGVTAPSAVAGVSGPACNILNLSLGPIDLNLLGLNVHLDNCHNGPVTVDVTAQPGHGNLLGNLLCSLSHALDNGNANQITQFINRVAGELLRILG